MPVGLTSSRRLAARQPVADADALHAELAGLERRRAATLVLLDGLHADQDERVVRGSDAIRARASQSPRTRRETPEAARRRLGLPGR